MVLPTPKVGAGHIEEGFKLQTVLALQHLWRIGQEMGVQWWTSAVAYVPRESLYAVKEKAAIAGQAWTLLHARDESEDEEGEERDIWKERHCAGMKVRGAKAAAKMLPDWGIVEGLKAPPVFVVEVEELPRGAGVEWHAQVGVVGGMVKVSFLSLLLNRLADNEQVCSKSGEGWVLHQCAFGTAAQSTVAIGYASIISDLRKSVDEALVFLGRDPQACGLITSSYLDNTVGWVADMCEFGGMVPCRSIWDGEGGRLAALLILDN